MEGRLNDVQRAEMIAILEKTKDDLTDELSHEYCDETDPERPVLAEVASVLQSVQNLLSRAIYRVRFSRHGTTQIGVFIAEGEEVGEMAAKAEKIYFATGEDTHPAMLAGRYSTDDPTARMRAAREMTELVLKEFESLG